MGSEKPQEQRSSSTFVLRPNAKLSNVAAEYIEHTVGPDLCRQATGGLVEIVDDRGRPVGHPRSVGDIESRNSATVRIQAPHFDRIRDGFIPPDEVERHAQYYKESQEAAQKFKLRLTEFAKTLQSRRVFEDFEIEYREPSQFDVNYVLEIANTVREGKKPGTTDKLKDFIRNMAQKVVRYKDGLSTLLSIIPSDIYGSLISGGFSMILMAVEKHEKLRSDIQETLANIPERLREVLDLSELPRTNEKLHACADKLFLSIFQVLESVIIKVTNKTFDKLKPGKKEKDIGALKPEEAIKLMSRRVQEFQDAATFCTQLRIGRMDNTLIDIQDAVSRLEVNSQLDGQKIKELEALLAFAFDNLYEFLGPALEELLRRVKQSRIQPQSLPALSRSTSQQRMSEAQLAEENHRLVDTWLSGLGELDATSEKQITACLIGFGSFEPHDKDKIVFIMASDEYKSWLNLKGPRILSIQEENAPEELMNPLTFSAALLAITLGKMTQCPILSFFCGLKQQEHIEGFKSDAQIIRSSLNGQLLQFMATHRQTVSLSFINNERFLKRAQNSPRYAKRLFRKLLEALPAHEVVYIIIDSFSRLQNPSKDENAGNDLIRELVSLTTDLPLTIKLLVTDALPSCPIHDMADLRLQVPSDVDGWRTDMSMASIGEQSTIAISQFASQEDEEEEEEVVESNLDETESDEESEGDLDESGASDSD